MPPVNVQAGAAAYVVQRRPAAKDALAAIQRAGGDVLDELTAMLTLLRGGTRSARCSSRPDWAPHLT